jgi:carbon-monoxide dehydrogenase large subunit
VLRRRNLIGEAQMPYTNPFGMIYDSGRYVENMSLAMQRAGWDGFEKRRAEAQGRGLLLGRGLANYVESSVGTPREQARMTVRPDSGDSSRAVVEVVVGTQLHSWTTLFCAQPTCPPW